MKWRWWVGAGVLAMAGSLLFVRSGLGGLALIGIALGALAVFAYRQL